MSECATCQRGSHESCTGYDGSMTVHPDSLPLCDCHCCDRRWGRDHDAA
jgi:hypothetical protein